MRSTWVIGALVLSACLAACGGGGGGGGGGDAGGAAVTFAPAVVSGNVASGTSATLTVVGTARNPSDFSGTVYIYVVDTQRVITPNVELTWTSNRSLSATLHTTPTLAAGRYQGNFQVQLCRDAACATPIPGSPVPLPYDITVTPAPLRATPATSTTASVHQGGTVSAPVTVAVAVDGLSWTATTATAWLQLSGGAGTGNGSFSVAYAPQGLAQGSYTGSVTVRASDGQTVALPFSVEVLPTAFVLSSGVPSFTAVNGAPIAPQTLSFELDNGVASPWQAAASAPWMLVTPLSGTTPAVVTLQPDPTRGRLASGVYSADLSLSSGTLASRWITSQLTLTPPTLSAAAASVTLGGPKGRDMASAQSVSVSLNTGSNAWPYALSELPAWATGARAGTVGGQGTPLSFTPAASGITPGSRSATVTMTATVNGDQATLPITLNLNADQRRLLPSEWGVGLASTPTGTVLTRTLTVRDNFGGALAWTASSSAAWLSVSAAGTTGGSSSLTLSADPASLPVNTVSIATVTIRTSAADVSPATVQVGLWKSASGLATIGKLPLTYANVVADKIRPYVFVNNGGTSIDVYNAYTTQRVTTINGVGAALGAMTVAPDGSTLYALDTANRSMAVIDLASLSKTGDWALVNATNSATTLVAVKPNGVDLVLLDDRTGYKDGRSLGDTGVAGTAATADGQRLFSLGTRWAVDYSEMSGGMVFGSALGALDIRSGGNPLDVAVNKEGTRAYAASGGGTDSGYRCAVIDAVNGTFIGALPGGDAYPNNVEVTTDGRAICGIMGYYSTYDIWVHAPNGAFLQGYKFAGYAKTMKTRQMVVTPDGLVVVALTDDPLIAFVPIGP